MSVPSVAVTVVLNTIEERLRRGREAIIKGRWATQRDLRNYGEHYLDGKLAGYDSALATIEQLRDEIMAEAERLQRERTGKGFTNTNHR